MPGTADVLANAFPSSAGCFSSSPQFLLERAVVLLFLTFGRMENRSFRIDGYLKTIICADDADEHKPVPAPLIKYMELANCNKNELLYIGDSAYDMECAMRVGSDFTLTGWGTSKQLNAPISFAAPHEVLKWLAGSN